MVIGEKKSACCPKSLFFLFDYHDLLKLYFTGLCSFLLLFLSMAELATEPIVTFLDPISSL